MISNFVSKFFNSLNEQRIKYAILRNYESMPNRPENKKYFDLDIFVLSSDLKKFNIILSQTILSEEALLFKTLKDKSSNSSLILFMPILSARGA